MDDSYKSSESGSDNGPEIREGIVGDTVPVSIRVKAYDWFVSSISMCIAFSAVCMVILVMVVISPFYSLYWKLRVR